MEREPIQYTVENKNGVHEYSNSSQVNDTVKIRINILHPVGERNPLTYIVKKISCQDGDIHFDDSATAWSGQCSTVNDLRTKVFIKNTSDLKFELIENAKIAIMLLFKGHEPKDNYLDYEYAPPPRIIPNSENIKSTPTPKFEFHIERINGVIKFTPENIEINKKIGLVRASTVDKEMSIDISFNFNGFLFKRNSFDPYGGKISIQNFYTFNYLVKNIKELEFIDVPENVKLKIELFEALPINPSRKLFSNEK